MKQVRTIRARALSPTNKNLSFRVALRDLKFGTRKIISCDGKLTLGASIDYLKSMRFDVFSYSVNEIANEYLINIAWYPLDLPEWENKYINGKRF